MNRVWVAALVCLLPAVSSAANPVILVDARVAPYREAAESAAKHLPNAVQLDPSDPTAAAKLPSASLVLAVGQKAFSVALEKAGRTPVVFCTVLGVSRSQISSTVTGVPLETDPEVFLKHLKTVLPEAKRVGFIVNPKSSDLFVTAVKRAAQTVELEVEVKAVSSPKDVTQAASSLIGKADAIWLAPDPRLFPRDLLTFLLGFTAERKVPLFGFVDGFTQAGALGSVSPNYASIGENAGKLAASILSRGTPVPAPEFAPGTFTLNAKTAQALGISLSPQALAAARAVYR